MNFQNALLNCRRVIRDRAYHDCYLPLACHSAQSRSALWPLHALQLELAAIADTQSQSPQLQRMRWMWWKERVMDLLQEESAGDAKLSEQYYSDAVRGNPVLQGLVHSIGSAPISESRLQLTSLFRGYDQWLSTDQMVSVEQIEQVADQTLGSILRLQLAIIRQQSAETLTGSHQSQSVEDHAASHLAKAMLWCRLLRSVRLDARLFQRCRLPAQSMAEHCLSSHQLLQWLRQLDHDSIGSSSSIGSSIGSSSSSSSSSSGKGVDVDDSKARLQEIVFQLASNAHIHLETAQEHLAGNDSNLRVATSTTIQSLRLFTIPVKRYLELLRRQHFDVIYNDALPRFDWSLHWQFLRLVSL